jgi:hypothetical protein
MNFTRGLGLALGMTIVVGCGSSASDNTVSDDANEINQAKPADPAEPAQSQEQTMEVDDLDGDDVKEKFVTTRDQCGTGGCTWKINLSSKGYAGEVFANDVRPLPRGTETTVGNFFAHSKGGYCLHYLTQYKYDGNEYQKQNEIDCLEVFHRSQAGGAVSQFEGACLALIDPEICKDQH